MRKIYFFLPEYPRFTTGGIKYHNYVYEYIVKKSEGIEIIGKKPDYEKIKNSVYLKLLTGFYYVLKVKRGSIIVVTNTEYLYFLLPVFISKILKRHKYYMIIHHLVSDQRKSKIKNFIERLYIKTADKIVTVSKTTLRNLRERKILNEDAEIIEPGLDIIPDKEIQIRNNDIFRILFVGTIEHRKGLNILIEALHQLNYDKFELTVVGSVKNKIYYNDIIELLDRYKYDKKIKFLEYLKTEELKEVYKNSDCLCFPTFWEGYGMVVTEAMACGLPIIASDIPSIKELMQDGVQGFLVERARPDLIAGKLKILIDNPEIKKAMAENSLITARKFRNWSEIAELHYVLLDKFRNE